jgi:hypothetical protein
VSGEDDPYDRAGIQWNYVVERTLHEGEERLSMTRLYGLRLEFEYVDSLGGFPRSAAEADEMASWIQRQQPAQSPAALQKAITDYERIRRGSYPDNQLDGPPIGETMTEEEARLAMYEAIAEEGRRERERARSEAEDE